MQGEPGTGGEGRRSANLRPTARSASASAGEESARTFTAALQAHGMMPNIDFIADGDPRKSTAASWSIASCSPAPPASSPAGRRRASPLPDRGAASRAFGPKRGRWRRRRAKAWPRTSAARLTVPKIASIRLSAREHHPRRTRAVRLGGARARRRPARNAAARQRDRRPSARRAPRVRSGAAFDAAPARCGALASDSATGNDAARPILKETGRRGVYTLKAYAPRADGSLALTGFNMVALADGRGLFDSAADDIGALRAEITRNAFQARTT